MFSTMLLLLLPLALQPTVGFGLSNNDLPSFPICHQLFFIFSLPALEDFNHASPHEKYLGLF